MNLQYTSVIGIKVTGKLEHWGHAQDLLFDVLLNILDINEVSRKERNKEKTLRLCLDVLQNHKIVRFCSDLEYFQGESLVIKKKYGNFLKSLYLKFQF